MKSAAYTLPAASEEQKNIIAAAYKGNVIVDAVAGSGKTTTNLHIAAEFTTLKILLLTYNARLKLETRDKAADLNLSNLKVSNYHSFAVEFYNKKAYTSAGFSNIIKKDLRPLKSFDYDIIIIDEAQDMNPEFYKFVCKILRDSGRNNTRFIIMGDQAQSIYSYVESSPLYIKCADKIFDFGDNLNDIDRAKIGRWNKCDLSTTYRITADMAAFINKCCLKTNKLIAAKPPTSQKNVRYLFIENIFFYSGTIQCYKEIKMYLNCGYRPEDIFVLAPSVRRGSSLICKKGSPISNLMNYIKTKKNNQINIYAPTSDEGKIDEDVSRGKIIFSSFHQAKGLERKVAIVFGFDNSYYKYYGKNAAKDRCPNIIYVAITRAKEKMTLIHSGRNNYLDFLEPKYINEICEVPNKISNENKDKDFIRKNTVTDLLRNCSPAILNKCFKKLKVKIIVPPGNIINIPDKICTNKGEKLYEDVCDITGTFLPIYYKYNQTGEFSIINQLLHNIIELKELFKGSDTIDKIKKINIKFMKEELTIDEFLFIVNCWMCYKSKINFKVFQINKYDWISAEIIRKSFDRLNELDISADAIFEAKGQFKNNIDETKNLLGYIDCIDYYDSDVNKISCLEFKCTQELTIEHFIQAALYLFIVREKIKLAKEPDEGEKPKPSDVIFKIFNIKSGELCEIAADDDDLNSIFEVLLRAKESPEECKNDENNFISAAEKMRKKYYQNFGS